MRKSASQRIRKYFASLVVFFILGIAGFCWLYQDEARMHIQIAKTYSATFMEYFERTLLEKGVKGPLYLFAVYLVTTVLMLPLWGFHVTTGYAYGTFRAALLISVVQAVCAGFAFANSRYFAKPYIRGYLRRKFGGNFDAIDANVSRKGLQTTILLRLSPLIPFGVNNYLCGCTNIELWKWVLGTWIGVLPGTTAYCHMGALGKQAATQQNSSQQLILMSIQIVAALGLVWYMTKAAQDALKKDGIGPKTGGSGRR